MKSIHVKITTIVLLATVLLGISAIPVSAYAPYDSYNYNYWEEPTPSPAAYLPEDILSGRSLGIGDFKEPSDLYVDSSGAVYVLDSGNNRLVILDHTGEVSRVISSFQHDGAEDHFNKPEGLYVTDDGFIYVADTENKRIVVLSPQGELKQIIRDPESDLFASNFTFYPTKLAVDKADRVYVVARGVYEGIVQFDDQGGFIGYIGTIKVNPSAADYIWKLISTQAQREQMALFVPTEFSNLDIDSQGFLYATNIDVDSKEPIKRLSPSGHDVLKRYGYFDVRGDINFFRLAGAGIESGPSKIVDVKIREGGKFSMIDSLRGRVFTYDAEGNLLYIFGGKGSQVGTFKSVAAIEEWKDRLLVLDRGTGRITIFRPIEFGAKVNQAVAFHAAGEEQQAVAVWKEVLRLNSNYDTAYIGIGKALLVNRQNKEAMNFFKLGMDHQYYSVAFKRYRKEVMQGSFSTVMTIALALAVAGIGWSIYRKRKSRGIQA